MAEPAKPAPRKKGGKKRERREVRTCVAHVQATLNNTIVTLTDKMGNVVPAAGTAPRKAMESGLKQTGVFVRGPGAGREAAIRSLQAVGLEITAIRDVT